MEIRRTAEEIVITLPASIDTEDLQRLIDYLTYKEATGKSTAKQADVDALAEEVKESWWANNRHRLVK